MMMRWLSDFYGEKILTDSNRTLWALRLTFGAILMIVLLGGVVAFVRQQFGIYLIILFPILMGAVAGLLGQGMRERLGTNVIVAILASIVLGLLTYAFYRYADYLLFIRELGRNVPTFQEYTELQAELGLSIGRVTSSSSIPLEGNVVYIYWLIEMGIVALLAAIAARRPLKNVKVT
jgi:hypothetical protein